MRPLQTMLLALFDAHDVPWTAATLGAQLGSQHLTRIRAALTSLEADGWIRRVTPADGRTRTYVRA